MDERKNDNAKERFIDELRSIYNEETVNTIVEAVEHPETLHKLQSWDELGL